MEQTIDISIAFLCLILILVSLLLLKYNWDRRWLYFHSWKMQGPPLALPLIGNGYSFIDGPDVFLETLQNMITSYPDIFKLWLGKNLMIVISNPRDVENILNNNVEKGPYYKWGKDFLKNCLLISPEGVWRSHRKVINPTFNPRILNTFPRVFEKHSKHLVKSFEDCCGKDTEVLNKLWRCTLDMACEVLLDVDVNLLQEQDQQILRLLEAERLVIVRACKPWLHLDTLWELSSFCKEMKSVSSEMLDYVAKIVQMKKVEVLDPEKDAIQRKRFLNHLLSLQDTSDKLTNQDIIEESNFMVLAASETTAATAGYALLVLGLRPDIQDKVHQELDSIFGNSTRDITLEDLARMDYLERLIKETLRMFPPIPVVMRQMDKDYFVKPYTFPKDSIALVPIYYVHKNPKYWSEPETFNPDRFLPENFQKMPRGSFIPFSYGPRNCMGFTYGLMSMKVLLSTLLRSYRVCPPVDYASIADIKFVFNVIIKPNKNFRVKLISRSSKECREHK